MTASIRQEQRRTCDANRINYKPISLEIVGFAAAKESHAVGINHTLMLNVADNKEHFTFLFQIVFEATRGASVRSDIAIDDIVLEGGPCQGKYPLPSSHFILKKSLD